MNRFLTAIPALLLVACAETTPATVVVADKDVQVRLDTDPVGVWTDPRTGRVREVRREEIYREYWVKGTDGTWYRIPREDWETATVGQPLVLRPGGRERVTSPPTTGPCIGPDGRWRC